jgi:hypothetical protein
MPASRWQRSCLCGSLKSGRNTAPGRRRALTQLKKTNVNRPRDDPERAYAALSLRTPHIPSMHLPLGSMHLPLNAATKTFAILAKRGAGKSNTGAVLAEAFHKHHIPFVVCDPIDVWGGLRLAHTGKDKGLPVVVFGRAHADIPLTCEMGREAAPGKFESKKLCSNKRIHGPCTLANFCSSFSWRPPLCGPSNSTFPMTPCPPWIPS